MKYRTYFAFVYFLFFCIFNLYTINYTKAQLLNFESFSYENGLNTAGVNCIKQDTKGFIWLGTLNGLFRFDGNTFYDYQFFENKINLTNIQSIQEDKYGNLWLSTENMGLYIYNTSTDVLQQVKLVNNDYERIGSILFVKNRVYLGTRKGLYHFEHPGKNYSGESIKCEILRFNEPFLSKTQANSINTLLYNSTQNQEYIWIGTNGALFKYNIQTKEVYYIGTNPQYAIWSLANYDETNIIVGSWDGGIFLVDNLLNQKHFDSFSTYINSIIGKQKIVSILVEDEKIWLGTVNSGLYIFYRNTNNSFSYQYVNGENNDFNANIIRSIYQDKNGIVWIGSEQQCLIKINPDKSNQESYFLHSQTTSKPIENIQLLLKSKKNSGYWFSTRDNGIIYTTSDYTTKFSFSQENSKTINLGGKPSQQMMEDRFGNLWCTLQDKGLFFIPENTINEVLAGKQSSIRKAIDISSLIQSNGIIDQYVIQTFQDSKNRIWVSGWGTTSYIKVLANLQSIKSKEELLEKTKPYLIASSTKKFQNGLLFSPVISFAEDSKQRIWLGTKDNGVIVIEDTKNGFSFQEINTNNSLTNNTIIKLFQDSEKRMWVATNGGISILKEDGSKIADYSTKNGLPSNYVIDIVQNERNSIWVIMPYSVSVFNVTDLACRNILLDKNTSKLPIISAACKNDKLVLQNATTIFEIDAPNISKKNDVPFYFTDIKIDNQRIFPKQEIDGTIVLEQNINECKKIIVPHNKLISIEFSALDYINSKQVLYKYKIDKSEEWVILNTNQRNILLSNLPIGVHKIYFLASNHTGKWNEAQTELTIQVLPPWYLSPFAKIIYAIVILGLILALRKITIIRIREKDALERERFARNNVEELNRIKTDFFTNISHEIRTPLTLIISPIDNLITNAQLSENVRETMLIIQRNSKRLLRLINELMDFSKIENNALQIHKKETEFISFCMEICKLFQNQINNQNIKFSVKTSLQRAVVRMDTGMIEKVIFNLLSNAFKYVNENGMIEILIEKNTNYAQNNTPNTELKLSIKNTGKPIPETKLPKIFDRYFQVDNMQPTGKPGTGIGLSLVKNFVEMHSGHIHVTSNEVETCFSIFLPYDENLEEMEPAKASENIIMQEDTKEETATEIQRKKAESHYKVLIVEDNEEIRNYIKNEFSSYFTVYEADNGTKGLQTALQYIPDIIITDIMMPEMNGLEMSKELRANLATSHIPILILSAKAEMENQIEGLMTGADVYIIKPFNIHFLKVQVERLIQLKESAYARFLKEMNPMPEGLVQNSIDETFMNTIFTYIEENIEHTDLNIEQIANHIKLSKSQIYRKIKSISGITPIEFLRTVRLKKAAQLIMQGTLNFSEIAYKTGFSSPSYFTRSFREHFGKSPSEFANDYQKRN